MCTLKLKNTVKFTGGTYMDKPTISMILLLNDVKKEMKHMEEDNEAMESKISRLTQLRVHGNFKVQGDLEKIEETTENSSDVLNKETQQHSLNIKNVTKAWSSEKLQEIQMEQLHYQNNKCVSQNVTSQNHISHICIV